MVCKHFLTGSESKYSKLCGSDSLVKTNGVCCSNVKAAIGNTNGHGCATLKTRTQTQMASSGVCLASKLQFAAFADFRKYLH